MWDTNRDKIEEFLLKANSFHSTIKFTAEISETETIFLDTIVYKGVDQRCRRIHGSLLLSIPRGFFSVVVVLYSYIVEYVFV